MPDPAINPTSVGEPTYQVTNSKGLVADLRLAVPISSPFPTFDLTYPSGAAGLSISLVRGATALPLLPGPLVDDPFFTNRLVNTGSFDDGAETVLTVEIKATAMPSGGEDWRIEARADDATTFRLTQAENNDAVPTIRRVMCDPVARFSVVGGVAQGPGVVTVKAKSAVRFEAAVGPTPGTVVKVPNAPAPAVHYRWSSSGAVTIPGLPSCGTAQSFSFEAPMVSQPVQTAQVRLEVWLEGACPATVGLLNSAAETSLRVEAMVGEFDVGPEVLLSPNSIDLDERDAYYLLDRGNGLVAFWSESPPLTILVESPIQVSRLDLNNVSAGFGLSTQVASSGMLLTSPFAVALPNGEVLLAYSGFTFDFGMRFKQAPLGGLDGADEQRILLDFPPPRASLKSVCLSGDLVVFFFFRQETRSLEYKRYRHTDRTWIDQTPQRLSTPGQTVNDLATATDADGHIWVAYSLQHSQRDLHVLRLTPADGAKSFHLVHQPPTNPSRHLRNPFVLCTAPNEVWVFAHMGEHGVRGLHYLRFTGGNWQSLERLPNSIQRDVDPLAVADSAGGIWLFWFRGASAERVQMMMRRDPATGAWGAPNQLPNVGKVESALITPDNNIWIFYPKRVLTTFGSPPQPIDKRAYRRIITAV